MSLLNFFPTLALAKSIINHSAPNSENIAVSNKNNNENNPLKYCNIAKRYNPVYHNRPWVIYDAEADVMYCKYCKNNRGHAQFSRTKWADKGMLQASKCSMSKHQNKNIHKDSITRECETEDLKNADDIIMDMKSEFYIQLKPLISVSYWLGKTMTAVNKIDSLHELLSYNNQHPPDKQYFNAMGVAAMQRCISLQLYNELNIEIRNSELPFSVMIDESNDISTTKHLIIYVRFLLNSIPQTRFLGLVHVDKCDAENITKELLEYLIRCGLNLKQLYSFTSDGASVMTGAKNGVSARLTQQINLHLVSMHCCAHRLELASLGSAHEFPILVEVETTLNEICKFFKMSAVRLGHLKHACKFVEIDFKRPIRSVATRWLSLFRSCDRINYLYPAIVIVIQHAAELKDKQAEHAKALIGKIRKLKFIVCMSMLQHHLTPVYEMCQIFQREDITINKMSQQIKSTISQIKTNSALGLTKEIKQLLVNAKLCREAGNKPLYYLFDHCKVTGYNDEDITDLNDLATDYCNGLIEAIETRFPNEKIIDSFKIFDLNTWPHNKPMEMFEFGIKPIQVLGQHFGRSLSNETKQLQSPSVVNSKELYNEWFSFRSLITTKYNSTDNTLPEKFDNAIVFKRLQSEYQSGYKNLFKLANIYHIISPSSAPCERGFSSTNLIKTPLRNKITTDTLDSAVRITTHPRKLSEIDFTETLNIWQSYKNKRLILNNIESDIIYTPEQLKQLQSTKLPKQSDQNFNLDNEKLTPIDNNYYNSLQPVIVLAVLIQPQPIIPPVSIPIIPAIININIGDNNNTGNIPIHINLQPPISNANTSNKNSNMNRKRKRKQIFDPSDK